jgi:dephospho-CoA kinase
MRRVALTGGIATGKSHVRAEFERLGVPTIDADVLARDVVAPGTEALSAIVARFGPEMLDEHQSLDRRRMAGVVFADPAARRDLERIIHPAVSAATNAWLRAQEAEGRTIALADIPLLYETGRERDFDIVITTACDPETQVRRVMARDKVNEAEARQRIQAQMPTAEKAQRADYVIHTDGSLDDTHRQVRDVLAQIRAREG